MAFNNFQRRGPIDAGVVAASQATTKQRFVQRVANNEIKTAGANGAVHGVALETQATAAKIAQFADIGAWALVTAGAAIDASGGTVRLVSDSTGRAVPWASGFGAHEIAGFTPYSATGSGSVIPVCIHPQRIVVATE